MSDKYSLRLGDEFCFDGSKYEFLSYVRQKLALREKSMTPEMLDTAEGYADSFLDCLLKPTNRDDFTTIPVEEIKLSLEDGEYIGVRDNEGNRNHDNKVICVSINEYEFYVNLRSTTVTLLALLLDLIFTDGIASTVLALLGVNSRALAHIPSITGERCVLIETCRQKGRTANSKVFEKIKGCECVNNNLTCKFKKGNMCNISDIDINVLFESLVDKNVLTKNNDKYKYNL